MYFRLTGSLCTAFALTQFNFIPFILFSFSSFSIMHPFMYSLWPFSIWPSFWLLLLYFYSLCLSLCLSAIPPNCFFPSHSPPFSLSLSCLCLSSYCVIVFMRNKCSQVVWKIPTSPFLLFCLALLLLALNELRESAERVEWPVWRFPTNVM